MTIISDVDLKKIEELGGIEEAQWMLALIEAMGTETLIKYINIYNQIGLEIEKFFVKFCEYFRLENQNKSPFMFQKFLLESNLKSSEFIN